MTKKVLFAAMGAALAVAGNAQTPVLNYVKQVQTGNLTGQHIACVAVDGTSLYVGGYRNGTSGAVNITRLDNWNTSNASVVWTVELARGVAPDVQALNRDTDIAVTANEVLAGASMGDSTNKCVYRLDKATGALLTLGGLEPFAPGYMQGSTWSTNNFQKIGIDNGFAGGGPVTLAAMLYGSSSLNRASLPEGVTQGVVAGITGAVDLNGNAVTRSSSIRDFSLDANGDAYTRVDNGTGGAPAGIYQNVRTSATSFQSNVVFRGAVPITGQFAQFSNLEFVPGNANHDPFFLLNNRLTTNGNRFETWTYGSASANVALINGYDGGAEGNSSNNRPWRYESNVQNFDYTDAANGTRYIFVTGFKADDANTNPTRLSKQTVDIYQIGEDGKVTLNLTLNNYDGTPTGGRTIAIQVLDASTNAVLDARTLVTPSGSPAAGSITFYTTARGAVKISAKANGFLRNSLLGSAGATAISGTVALTGGDVDNSGEIDAADIDLVIADFGSTPTVGDTAPTDVDGSGEVDAADIDLVIANFGATDN